jgi:carboxylesterase type B
LNARILLILICIGLFHRAIAQSGATGCPWALHRSVGEYTRLLAEDLNCPTSNSRELLACLRNIDAKQIMESRKKLMIPIVIKIRITFLH